MPSLQRRSLSKMGASWAKLSSMKLFLSFNLLAIMLTLLLAASWPSCVDPIGTPQPLDGYRCSGDDDKRFITDADGNCTVCDTTRGFIPMGRDGAFCFIPGTGSEFSYQRLFTSVDPAPPIVARTFVGELGRENQSGARLPYSSSGNLSLGLPADWTEPIWLDSACADRDLYTVLIDNNPGIPRVSILSEDPSMPDGSHVAFIINGLDVNGDCQEDLGYASGKAIGDTVRMVVHWRSNDLPNPSGDTVRTDSALIYPLPAEYQ